MKLVATLAIAAAMLAPGIASACNYHEQHATKISCAAGQVFDDKVQTCVPQTS
jgi:hypothetical protein